MESRKAGILLILWSLMMAAALMLTPFFQFAAGVLAGSLITAGVFGFAIKWSIEDMLSDTFGNVEQMQEQLSDNRPDLTPDE